MSGFETQFFITIIGGTIILLLLAVFLFTFFIFFQRRQTKNREEQLKLKAQYEKEILHAQIEIQNQTLAYIGHELHDNIGQLLSVTTINLNVMEESLESKDYDDFHANFHQAKQLMADIIEEVRGLSKSLDGSFVKDFGLVNSISNELQRIRKTRKFETEIIIEGDTYNLGVQQEIIVFRIVQEVLNNAIKHAKATHISVSLNYELNAFRLIIADNGIGFDLSTVFKQTIDKSGIGLKSIQNRIALINGEAVFESANGKGTKVIIHLPRLTQMNGR